MKKGVRYIDDIIKEVAKEQGLGFREAKEVWKIHIKDIERQTENPDVDYIALPNLGNLYFNSKLYNFFNSKDKINEEKYPDLRDKVNKLEKLREEDLKEGRKSRVKYLNFQLLNIYKILAQVYQKFGLDSTKYRPIRKTIKILEKYSNDTLTKNDLRYRSKKDFNDLE